MPHSTQPNLSAKYTSLHASKYPSKYNPDCAALYTIGHVALDSQASPMTIAACSVSGAS